MKILAVADAEAKPFYDCYIPGILRDYDLILSCGDLSPRYLEFLVTMARCPLLYVHGNHDERYGESPPEGCRCIDGVVTVYQGVRIGGLGGCRRYREGPYMYTEGQMARRVLGLRLQIWRRGGLDILVTHAPPRGVHDLEDLPHRGFTCFRTLLNRVQPRYAVHGHIHRSYGAKLPQRTQLGETTVLNAYERCTFEL